MAAKVGKKLPTLNFKARSSFRSKAKPELKKSGLVKVTMSDEEKLESIAADPPGTLPERLVRAWLIARNIQYIEQGPTFGGTLRIGGAVVDFILPFMGSNPGTVIRVQGDYWHTMDSRIAKDRAQYERLVAKGYTVVDLWEGDLKSHALGGDLFSWIDSVLTGGAESKPTQV